MIKKPSLAIILFFIAAFLLSLNPIGSFAPEDGISGNGTGGCAIADGNDGFNIGQNTTQNASGENNGCGDDGSGGTFQSPIEANPSTGAGNVTDGYGYRERSTGSTYHCGVDIAAPLNTPVLPIADGGCVTRVVNDQSNATTGYGNQLVIDYGNGLVVEYLHLASVDITEGQCIGEDWPLDEPVAKVGSTGSSTGNHLDMRTADCQNPQAIFTCLSDSTMLGQISADQQMCNNKDITELACEGENANSEHCQQVDCAANPDDPSCTQQEPNCEENPDAEGCDGAGSGEECTADESGNYPASCEGEQSCTTDAETGEETCNEIQCKTNEETGEAECTAGGAGETYDPIGAALEQSMNFEDCLDPEFSACVIPLVTCPGLPPYVGPAPGLKVTYKEPTAIVETVCRPGKSYFIGDAPLMGMLGGNLENEASEINQCVTNRGQETTQGRRNSQFFEAHIWGISTLARYQSSGEPDEVFTSLICKCWDKGKACWAGLEKVMKAVEGVEGFMSGDAGDAVDGAEGVTEGGLTEAQQNMQDSAEALQNTDYLNNPAYAGIVEGAGSGPDILGGAGGFGDIASGLGSFNALNAVQQATGMSDRVFELGQQAMQAYGLYSAASGMLGGGGGGGSQPTTLGQAAQAAQMRNDPTSLCETQQALEASAQSTQDVQRDVQAGTFDEVIPAGSYTGSVERESGACATEGAVGVTEITDPDTGEVKREVKGCSEVCNDATGECSWVPNYAGVDPASCTQPISNFTMGCTAINDYSARIEIIAYAACKLTSNNPEPTSAEIENESERVLQEANITQDELRVFSNHASVQNPNAIRVDGVAPACEADRAAANQRISSSMQATTEQTAENIQQAQHAVNSRIATVQQRNGCSGNNCGCQDGQPVGTWANSPSNNSSSGGSGGGNNVDIAGLAVLGAGALANSSDGNGGGINGINGVISNANSSLGNGIGGVGSSIGGLFGGGNNNSNNPAEGGVNTNGTNPLGGAISGLGSAATSTTTAIDGVIGGVGDAVGGAVTGVGDRVGGWFGGGNDGADGAAAGVEAATGEAAPKLDTTAPVTGVIETNDGTHVITTADGEKYMVNNGQITNQNGEVFATQGEDGVWRDANGDAVNMDEGNESSFLGGISDWIGRMRGKADQIDALMRDGGLKNAMAGLVGSHLPYGLWPAYLSEIDSKSWYKADEGLMSMVNQMIGMFKATIGATGAAVLDGAQAIGLDAGGLEQQFNGLLGLVGTWGTLEPKTGWCFGHNPYVCSALAGYRGHHIAATLGSLETDTSGKGMQQFNMDFPPKNGVVDGDYRPTKCYDTGDIRFNFEGFGGAEGLIQTAKGGLSAFGEGGPETTLRKDEGYVYTYWKRTSCCILLPPLQQKCKPVIERYY